MSDISIDIPVKGYVYKYLLKRTGVPYRVNLRESIGVFLFSLLRNPYEQKKYDAVVSKYSGKFTVIIPNHICFRHGGRNVTSALAVNFSAFVEDQIKEKLYERVMIMNEFGKEKIETIESFADQYDFTQDDITSDGLKRAVARFPSSRNNNIGIQRQK